MARAGRAQKGVAVGAVSRLDVGLVVRDPEPMLAFYRDALGLEYTGGEPVRGGTLHRLSCGAGDLKLLALERVPEAANPPGGMLGGSGIRYVTAHVASVRAAADILSARGDTVVLGPVEHRPGRWVVIVEDPEGNWVEVVGDG